MGFTTGPGRGRTGLVSSPLEKHHVKTLMGNKGMNGYKSALKCSSCPLATGQSQVSSSLVQDWRPLVMLHTEMERVRCLQETHPFEE